MIDLAEASQKLAAHRHKTAVRTYVTTTFECDGQKWSMTWDAEKAEASERFVLSCWPKAFVVSRK